MTGKLYSTVDMLGMGEEDKGKIQLSAVRTSIGKEIRIMEGNVDCAMLRILEMQSSMQR
jgi:hypothetical protein